MPIIAIGAAALAIGTAATGIAAAGLTLVTALEAVAAVGATLGAIGAVTGDKTLGTIGMVLGAVGGIGSIAASAGLFGADAATAPLFGTGANAVEETAVTGVTNDLSNLGQFTPDLTGAAVADPLASVAANAGQGTTVAPDVFSALGSGSSSGAAADVAGAESAANSGVAAATAPQPVASAAPTSPPAVQSPASTGLINQTGPAASPVESVTVTAPTAPDVTPPPTPVAESPGFFGSIGKFAKDNPLVAYGVVQAAGSFISGATNPLTPAQVAALNAQAAANQANANITAQQASNMNQPIPVARRVAGGSGLINYTPTNAVTGRVAA